MMVRTKRRGRAMPVARGSGGVLLGSLVTAVWIAVLLAAGMVLSGCETMESVLDEGDRVKASVQAKTVDKASTGAVDFRSGEALCSISEGRSLIEGGYQAAQVLKPADSATGGQSEVLFVEGDKKWVDHVLPTHRTRKEELAIGEYVLYIWGQSDEEQLSERAYRTGKWYFGRVTSLDHLYKDMVEVEGELYYIKWLRSPDEKLEG